MFRKSMQMYRINALFLILLTLGMSSPVTAQVGEFFSGKLISDIPWRWMFAQKWDSESNSWGDTTSIVYTKGTLKMPEEIVNRAKDSNDIWRDLQKVVLTYANNRIKTARIYQYIPDSLKYTSLPILALNYSWEGDLTSKVSGELPLTTLMNLDPATLGMYAPLFAEIKILFEQQNTINGGKITEGIGRIKLSINPLIYALFVTMMSSSGTDIPLPGSDLPLDTNWINQIKTTYTYITGSEIQIQSSWSSSDSQWVPLQKDSLVYTGNKKSLTFHFNYDSTTNRWDLTSKDSTSYNLDNTPNQTVSMKLTGSTWENSNRSLYFYTDYSSSSARFSSNKSVKSNIIASKIYNFPDHPSLELELKNESRISIIITDLKGRTVYKATHLHNFAGTYSISLPVYACGSYLCAVRSENTMETIPFSIVK